MTALFGEYLKAAGFQGRNGYGTLTLENLGEYIAKEYLIPDATRYLKKLDDTEQKAYLSTRPWIKYDGEQAALTFEDFGLYATRDARVPAFDDLGMSQPSPILFGNETTNARHFTDYSEQLATGDASAMVDPALTDLVHSQNPTWHILQKHSDVAPHWWIRHGACDPSLAVPPRCCWPRRWKTPGRTSTVGWYGTAATVKMMTRRSFFPGWPKSQVIRCKKNTQAQRGSVRNGKRKSCKEESLLAQQQSNII